MSTLNEVTGDILSIDRGVICHGVNLQNKFGSGLAGAIAAKWPYAKEVYHWAFRGAFPPQLGDYEYAVVAPEVTVAHCFTQEHCGYDGKRYASLPAIRTALTPILAMANYQSVPVYLPRIGCGLGGLSWEDEVRPLYERLAERYTFTVMSLP